MQQHTHWCRLQWWPQPFCCQGYTAVFSLSQELTGVKSMSGFLNRFGLSVLFLCRFLLVRFPETCMKMSWCHSLRRLVPSGICASWWILFLVKTEAMLSSRFVVKMQHRKQSNWWVTYFQIDQASAKSKHTDDFLGTQVLECFIKASILLAGPHCCSPLQSAGLPGLHDYHCKNAFFKLPCVYCLSYLKRWLEMHCHAAAMVEVSDLLCMVHSAL